MDGEIVVENRSAGSSMGAAIRGGDDRGQGQRGGGRTGINAEGRHAHRRRRLRLPDRVQRRTRAASSCAATSAARRGTRCTTARSSWPARSPRSASTIGPIPRRIEERVQELRLIEPTASLGLPNRSNRTSRPAITIGLFRFRSSAFR